MPAAAVVLAALLWGTTGFAASFITGVNPLARGVLIFTGAGLLLLLVYGRQVIAARSLLRENAGILALGIITLSAYPLVFYTGMAYAGVSIGNVLMAATAPMFAGLLEKRRGLQFWLGVALGIVGTILLGHGSLSGHGDGTRELVGIACGISAGFLYAAYSAALVALMRRHVSRPAAIGAMFGGSAGVLVWPALFFLPALAGERTSILALLYLILLPMFIGYLAYGFGLSKIPASTATTITLLEPVGATILGVGLLHEQLASGQILGIACLFACLGIILRPARRSRRP